MNSFFCLALSIVVCLSFTCFPSWAALQPVKRHEDASLSIFNNFEDVIDLVSKAAHEGEDGSGDGDDEYYDDDEGDDDGDDEGEVHHDGGDNTIDDDDDDADEEYFFDEEGNDYHDNEVGDSLNKEEIEQHVNQLDEALKGIRLKRSPFGSSRSSSSSRTSSSSSRSRTSSSSGSSRRIKPPKIKPPKIRPPKIKPPKIIPSGSRCRRCRNCRLCRNCPKCKRKPDRDQDRGYEIVSGRFLKLHHAEKTWEEAQRTCSFELANLVTVDSLAINQWLANQGMKLWIGATDKENEGTFVWTNGNPVTEAEAHWLGGRLSGKPWQDCVAVNTGGLSGKWNDIRCDRRLPFVCQRS